MKKLGVTLLVCLVLVFLTGLTNVVVANAEDLGGTSDATITTDPGTEPVTDPILEDPGTGTDPTTPPDPGDPSYNGGDPYWDDGATP